MEKYNEFDKVVRMTVAKMESDNLSFALMKGSLYGKKVQVIFEEDIKPILCSSCEKRKIKPIYCSACENNNHDACEARYSPCSCDVCYYVRTDMR